MLKDPSCCGGYHRHHFNCPKKTLRDKWGNDSQTGARGLERGVRIVKGGRVKIGREFFEASLGYSLEEYEGKKVELRVSDAWALSYRAFDNDTGKFIAELSSPPKARPIQTACFICGKPVRGRGYESKTGRAHKKCVANN